MKRIWQLIFFATLCPVLYAGAQDLVPRREVATPTPAATPARSPETTPTPIPQSALALIPAPSATPAEAGTAASAPTMPDLSQLEQIFSKVTPGKEVELYRAHVEWRKLKNQTVNDPAVVEAKAAAEAATTDLEKRNRLRHYYELFYARMRALAPTPEMVTYLDSQKQTHLDLLDQPRVRPTPDTGKKPESTAAQSPPEQPPQATPEPSLPNE